MIGKVKWFNEKNGYGFILNEKTGEDAFFHYSAINVKGFKTLNEGDIVSYELKKTERGLQAINIEVKEPVNI
ncbi:MAG: cold-shock protein [Bacilli bacterium]